jgi:hypothetical protein
MTEDGDVEKSLAKLPDSHRALVQGFKIEFEPHNTLKGDAGHVGVIMTHPRKLIKVASPWNYGREFALLHEVGHLVYEKYVRGTDLEKMWEKIAGSVEHKKKNEPPEELFCHAYANFYAKHKITIHDHDAWNEFIGRLPK